MYYSASILVLQLVCKPLKAMSVYWLYKAVHSLVTVASCCIHRPSTSSWLADCNNVCLLLLISTSSPFFHGWLLIRTVDLTILCEIWHTVKSHFSLQLFCIALLRSISRSSSCYWFHFHSAITSSESWSWTELIPAKNETFSDVPNFMENLRRHFLKIRGNFTDPNGCYLK